MPSSGASSRVDVGTAPLIVLIRVDDRARHVAPLSGIGSTAEPSPATTTGAGSKRLVATTRPDVVPPVHDAATTTMNPETRTRHDIRRREVDLISACSRCRTQGRAGCAEGERSRPRVNVRERFEARKLPAPRSSSPSARSNATTRVKIACRPSLRRHPLDRTSSALDALTFVSVGPRATAPM